jgi:hypothetical protein
MLRLLQALIVDYSALHGDQAREPFHLDDIVLFDAVKV